MTKLRKRIDSLLTLKRKSIQTNTSRAWWRYLIDLGLIVLVITIIHVWQTKDSLPTTTGNQVPYFRLPTLSGSEMSNVDNNRVSVYYFFAPWCTICHLSIENLNTLKSEINTGEVNLYIVALDWKSKEEVASFAAQHDLPVEVILGTVKQQQEFKIKGFPTYYVTNANNQLKWVSVGYSTSLGLKARIKMLTE